MAKPSSTNYPRTFFDNQVAPGGLYAPSRSPHTIKDLSFTSLNSLSSLLLRNMFLNIVDLFTIPGYKLALGRSSDMKKSGSAHPTLAEQRPYGDYGGGVHLFPFRTEKLSLPALMVLR